jgi:DNA-binding NarL/FixJ family response regulator
MNGIDATRRIREVCPSTKVIILSMHASNEHVYQALRAGASGYLMKESAGSEVVHAVRAVYSGRRYLSREITETVIDNYMVSREIPPTQSPLVRLSSREREVLQLVVEGKSSAEIARTLSLSAKTVETYRSRIMEKLNIGNIPGLVKFAIKHGLTTLK